MTTPRELLAQNASQSQLSSFFTDKVGLVSVKSYGALGDGTTNDTAAIIATKAYAATNGLVSIYFPHGAYVVNAGTGALLAGFFLWGDNSTFIGDAITVNQIGTNITEYITHLTGLIDTPASYTGQSGKVLSVKNTEDVIEFVDLRDTFYTETEVDGLNTAQTNALNAHKTSTDHDGRYYTEDEIDTLDGANVKKTGNQTVAGVKTFSSSPIVPTPTTDMQASTKKYVDDKDVAQTSAINSTTDGSSGADRTGVTTIPTLAGGTVQAVLESAKARFDDIAEINVNVEVANTHVGADEQTYATLPARLDAMDTATAAYKADIATVSIKRYPRLDGETHDIPRINRAITYLSSLGVKAKLLFDSEEYILIPMIPEAGDTSANANYKRIRLRNNVDLVGIPGETIFKVSDNNPIYNTIVEDEWPPYTPTKNVKIQGITFDENVYNNTNQIDAVINNQKYIITSYRSENLTIQNCKFICNGISGICFRIGLQYIGDEINIGEFPHENFQFLNNEIEFIALANQVYYDNTFLVLLGQNSEVKGNKFKSIREDTNHTSGENTAIEIAGKNIECMDNTINDYHLGVDVNCLGLYSGDRNLKVSENIIHDCGRGIGIWSGAGQILNGVLISKNDIILNEPMYATRTTRSTRSGICFSNHTTNSVGSFKAIKLLKNRISMSDVSRDYLLTLAYPGVYVYNLDFDASFNGLYLGGSALSSIDGITASENEFNNLPTPSIWVGLDTNITNLDISKNQSLNCGYGQRSAVFTYRKNIENASIEKNKFIDTGSPTINGDKKHSFSGAFINVKVKDDIEFVLNGAYKTSGDIVRDGLVLANKIVNGNFVNATQWGNVASTLAALDNTLSVTATGTAASARVYQVSSIATAVGKKVFVKAKVRVTNALCKKIEIWATNPTLTVTHLMTVKVNPELNKWYDVSQILTIPNTFPENVYIQFVQTYADSATANGKVMQLQKVLVLDLSVSYDSGYEPESPILNSLIDSYFGSWFDAGSGIGGVSRVGVTALRPTVKSVGLPYFDTTLGKPIWWDGVNWKDSAGAIV